MKKIFSLGFILCVSAITIFLSTSVVRQQPSSGQLDLSALKAEIRAELQVELQQNISQELEALISQEVQEQVSSYVQQLEVAAQDTETTIAGDQQGSDIIAAEAGHRDRETIQEAVRRTVQEVMQQHVTTMTEQEMDEVVASGAVKPELTLPQGYIKETASETRMVLAQATGTDVAKETATKPAEKETTEDAAGEGPQKVESIRRTLEQKGSILLPRGKLQFEPSTSYAHFSSSGINIDGFTILPVLVVGEISVDTTKRDVLIQNFSFKYGLWNNLQAELRVPFRYQHDRITNTSEPDVTRSESGLGDIQMSLSRQVGWEGGLMPDMVASLSVKSKTGEEPYNKDIGIGTGHWAVSGGLVAAKSSDPAVIFGSVSYTHNFSETYPNFGKMEPGDSFGYSLGTAIALSYQTAINFSFDQSVTMKLLQNGQSVPNSFQNVANFKTGFNWAINERSAVDLAVSYGLTTDAPDFTVEVRFPYFF